MVQAKAISSIFLSLYMKQPNDIEYSMEYSLGDSIYQANNGVVTQNGKKVSDISQILAYRYFDEQGTY